MLQIFFVEHTSMYPSFILIDTALLHIQQFLNVKFAKKYHYDYITHTDFFGEYRMHFFNNLLKFQIGWLSRSADLKIDS